MVMGLLATASAAPTTVTAEADAFVLSSSPNANRGSVSTVRIRNSLKFSYLRFDVSGLPPGETVSSAALQVYALGGSKCTLGAEVLRAANDTWGETTITWRNQPGPIGPILSSVTWTSKGYTSFDVTPAVTGEGPVSFVLRHAVGCSATADATFQSREATSNRPLLAVETAPATTPACSDGADNDADGLTDFPADPGCTDANDADETDVPPPTPACSDGADNDTDGLTDFPADPGCTDANDTDETDEPPPPDSFSFTAAGDLGSETASTASLDAISTLAARTSGVKFHLALGDLSYNGVGSEPAYCSYVSSHLPAGFPFELISGNHENGTPTQPGSDGYIGNFAACLPDRIAGLSYAEGYGKEYFFDYPAAQPLARVVMIAARLPIDGDPYSYATGTAHYDWLAGTIDDARAAGIPWVIVGMHKPCLDMRENTCGIGGDLFDLLVEKRVDLVLAAHSHTYQRSKQLAHDSASCPSVPFQPAVADLDCVADDGADGTYSKGGGTVFVVDGTFGQRLYTLDTTDPETPYFASYMGLNVASNGTPGAFGITRYTVTGSQITANFVRTSGSGTFSDTFSISGGGDPNPPATPTGLTGTPGSRQVTLTWDASPDSDLLNYDLSYAPSSAAASVVTGIPKTQTTYTVTGLADGTQYDFAVRSRDTSGNVSPWSAPFTLAPGSTDATPPSVVITAPAPDATVNAKVAVAGTASDASGISTVEVAVDGGPFQLVTGTTSWTYTFKSTAYADGAHTITARAVDTAGNAGTSSVSVTFDNTGPPQPTGLTAAAGDTSVTLTWAASTAPDLANYDVSYRISPSGVWRIERVDPAPIDGSVSHTVMSLSNGTLYDFRVRARDLLGNTSTWSAIVSSGPTP